MLETAPTFADIRPWIALGLLAALLLWETISPFFHFPKGGDRLRHGGRNVALGLVNATASALAFTALWWGAATFSREHGIGLLHHLPWAEPLTWIAAILLLDAWTYGFHRMSHRIPLFWRFHRVHHSDPHMDVTTASRFHIGEIALSAILRVPVIILLGIELGPLVLYELLMFAVVQFHHANVSVTEKWDRILRIFIVTPFMHKVHHSRWRPETDSNYSALLSIWDRLFRSFRRNDRPHDLRLGLDEFDAPSRQSLRGMLGTPFTGSSRSPDDGD